MRVVIDKFLGVMGKASALALPVGVLEVADNVLITDHFTLRKRLGVNSLSPPRFPEGIFYGACSIRNGRAALIAHSTGIYLVVGEGASTHLYPTVFTDRALWAEESPSRYICGSAGRLFQIDVQDTLQTSVTPLHFEPLPDGGDSYDPDAGMVAPMLRPPTAAMAVYKRRLCAVDAGAAFVRMSLPERYAYMAPQTIGFSVPDTIHDLAVHDNRLYVFCSDSIWAYTLQGEAETLEKIATFGVVHGRCWAITPANALYAWTMRGLLRISPEFALLTDAYTPLLSGDAAYMAHYELEGAHYVLVSSNNGNLPQALYNKA